MTSYFAGLALGLSLIVAIGAQNAFVLKQGIQRHHVFWVCFVCAFSDALLISAGVAGFGLLVSQYPQIETFARYGGALFLLLYGLSNLYSAWQRKHQLTPQGDSKASLSKTLSLCLAFTWLNPHVYLDTVVLLGSVSTQYEATKLNFALGAISGSFLFFFALGYGARLLAPIFRHAKAWVIVDSIMGIIMLSLAYSLIK